MVVVMLDSCRDLRRGRGRGRRLRALLDRRSGTLGEVVVVFVVPGSSVVGLAIVEDDEG